VGSIAVMLNWILDADLRKFFDSVDHSWLMRFVGHRIGTIGACAADLAVAEGGSDEAGTYSNEEGTPQGAVISPLLANIYLHYAFDLWPPAGGRRKPRTRDGSCGMPTTLLSDSVASRMPVGPVPNWRSVLADSVWCSTGEDRLIEFRSLSAQPRASANRGEGKRRVLLSRIEAYLQPSSQRRWVSLKRQSTGSGLRSETALDQESWASECTWGSDCKESG